LQGAALQGAALQGLPSYPRERIGFPVLDQAKTA
jgi:hypothetical protein